MKRIAASALVAGVTVLLLLGCASEPARDPFASLPEAPEMAADVVLMHWVVEGAPPEIDEVILLHADGSITFLDRASGHRGEQYVGPEGASHFAELLAASGFGQLEHTYLPSKRSSADGRFVTLALRVDGDVKRVQWQEPAAPAAIGEALRELDQFMQAVRASAR